MIKISNKFKRWLTEDDEGSLIFLSQYYNDRITVMRGCIDFLGDFGIPFKYYTHDSRLVVREKVVYFRDPMATEKLQGFPHNTLIHGEVWILPEILQARWRKL